MNGGRRTWKKTRGMTSSAAAVHTLVFHFSFINQLYSCLHWSFKVPKTWIKLKWKNPCTNAADDVIRCAFRWVISPLLLVIEIRCLDESYTHLLLLIYVSLQIRRWKHDSKTSVTDPLLLLYQYVAYSVIEGVPLAHSCLLYISHLDGVWPHIE